MPNPLFLIMRFGVCLFSWPMQWPSRYCGIYRARGASLTENYAGDSGQFNVAIFAGVRHEAEPLVEWQCARMVQRACVDFEFRNSMRPGIRGRVVEKIISEMAADIFRHQSEIGELPGLVLTKI